MNVYEYLEGFVKMYIYRDKSSISIFCGADAHLSIDHDLFNSRMIFLKGHEITFNNVPNERLKKFNEAFDKMVEYQNEAHDSK